MLPAVTFEFNLLCRSQHFIFFALSWQLNNWAKSIFSEIARDVNFFKKDNFIVSVYEKLPKQWNIVKLSIKNAGTLQIPIKPFVTSLKPQRCFKVYMDSILD